MLLFGSLATERVVTAFVRMQAKAAVPPTELSVPESKVCESLTWTVRRTTERDPGKTPSCVGSLQEIGRPMEGRGGGRGGE